MIHSSKNYKKPHYVILTLEPGQKAGTITPADLMHHRLYYRQLAPSARVMAYGPAMNQNDIIIVLLVPSDNELEQIIINDPALTCGWLVIKQIIPFINDDFTSINKEYLIAASLQAVS